jgi:hypothetical protein
LKHVNDDVRVWAIYTVGAAAALDLRRPSKQPLPMTDLGAPVSLFMDDLKSVQPLIRQAAAWTLVKLAAHAKTTTPLFAQGMPDATSVHAAAAEGMRE